MDATMRRSDLVEQTVHAAAMTAAACAIGSLLLAASLAFAWLADQARISNYLSIAPVETIAEEPYAALYKSPDGPEAALMFDRGDSIPSNWRGWDLIASWRGMETGSGDFSQPQARPWSAHAAQVERITCGDAAQEAPIRVLDMRNWFEDMNQLVSADVGGITPHAQASGDRAACTDLSRTFSRCRKLQRITGIDRWDLKGITSLDCLFIECTSLDGIDLSAWDVSTVRNVAGLFYGCTALERIDITGWSMPECDNLESMLFGCCSLTGINGLDTLHCPNARFMGAMFRDCTSLESIDLSGFGMPGKGMLASCASLMNGCASLRFLDLSGIVIDASDISTLWMYSGSATLETLILSNRIRTGQAPLPVVPAADRSNVISAGYWISDDTGEAYGQHGLARHLDCIHSSDGPFRTVSFHAFAGGWGEDDAFAAVYQKEDGSMLLIMDKGSAAPAGFEGHPLVLEARDFLIDGERGSAAWRGLPLSETRILSLLAPISCRYWFGATSSIKKIMGLELLDMSRCLDVTDMFSGVQADRLDVERWKMRADAEGLSRLFRDCPCLTLLDLSRWTVEAELDLGQLGALNELAVPSNIRISNLADQRERTCARFDDGSWYAGGYGSPLTSQQVRDAVNAAHGTDSAPLLYTHEKIDRSYAAVYQSSIGYELVFGRGLEIPDQHGQGVLIASFRGLEEQDAAHADWMDFTADACPWSPYAAQVASVDCDGSACTVPLKPTDIGRWFEGMGAVQTLAALEKGALDASRVRNASWLFYGCASLERIPDAFISSFSAELKQAMGMFGYCSSLSSLAPIGAWPTQHLQDSSRMFEGCSSLASLELSGWSIQSLRYCWSMFRGCSALKTIALPSAFVSPMRADALMLAFYQCASLEELDGSTWDLSGTTTLFHAFNGCQQLKRIIGASEWDTHAVTTMDSTFRLCRALVLDCSSWNVGSVTDCEAFALGAPGVTSPFENAAAAADAPDDAAACDAPDPIESTEREGSDVDGPTLSPDMASPDPSEAAAPSDPEEDAPAEPEDEPASVPTEDTMQEADQPMEHGS